VDNIFLLWNGMDQRTWGADHEFWKCSERAGVVGVRESVEIGTSPGISDLASEGEWVGPSGMETLDLGSKEGERGMLAGGTELR